MSFRKHGIGLETYVIRPMCFFLICDLDFKPVMKTAGRVLSWRKGTRRRKKREIVAVRIAGAYCLHV